MRRDWYAGQKGVPLGILANASRNCFKLILGRFNRCSLFLPKGAFGIYAFKFPFKISMMLEIFKNSSDI